MRQPFRLVWWHWLLYAALAYFSWLMLQITWQYVPPALDVAFLRIKQEVIHLHYYQVAFYVHVYSAMFALAAGFTQFSDWFRKRHAAWHKRIGKIYFYTVVLLAGPSGLIMGYHANGGTSSKIAFVLLAVLWITTTLIAVHHIRHGRIQQHRTWMIRSYALTLSAITLRIEKLVLVLLFEPQPMDGYRIVAWSGWVLNLMVAEWIIRRYFPNSKV
ncbi:MAG: DUF2306 domain-containing protein [Flavobacteriales bacterium]